MAFRFCVVALVACGGRVSTIPIPATEATAELTTLPVVRDDLSAPFTLTASDGSGLAVTKLEAKAVVEGPLAFTELHLYFRNPEARVRQGTFQITLPPRAAISRFAMEIEGQLVEAEVVPRLIARRAYDDFLHRRQDPALLEHAAGNQFTAKVFPIAGGADKHLVISYSQPLPGIRYTLPLRGLPQIDRVDVELTSITADGKHHVDSLHERGWQPDRDFETTARGTPVAIGNAGTIAAQVEIAATTGPDVPTSLTILVDTSASRALGYERYLASLQRLVASIATRWGAALPISVVAFDQDSELIYSGAASGFGEVHRRVLVERGAAGASDLGQALDWIATHPRQRLLIVGDGVITAGAEGRELVAIAQRLEVERIDVALAGGLRDDRAATTLVSAKRHGAVLDLAADPVAVALGETVADIAIDIPGASWVYPRRIASARSGTKVMVYARGITSSTVDVIAGSTRRRLQVLPVARPLVDRAAAGAELAELEERLSAKPGDTTLRTAIASKSVAARVLSSETSMLVLETDADYARYGIDRRALGEVLVVGPHGLEARSRAPQQLAGASTRPTEVATRDPLGPDRPVTPTPTLGDTDHDGVVDSEDRCPSEAETFNGRDDDDGCPDRGRVIVTDSHIIILESVHFQYDKAVVLPQAYPILDAVAAVLIASKDIALVEVGGHTDSRGDDARNLELSDRRARAVRDYLIAKGVEPDRLTAQGYGEAQPKRTGNTPEAWASNRRVDFLILRRADSPTITPSPATPPPPPPPAVTGELGAIQTLIAAHDPTALSRARAWHAREPGNVLALVGLGEALEAAHAPDAPTSPTAARIYGSIIDLFPGRADLRRFAGERLARLPATSLSIDTFRRAVADRPDHMTGHRLLAYAYVRANRLDDAFTAILAGLDHDYRATSYAGGRRVLSEDAGLIGAVYAAREPSKRAEIARALTSRKLALATSASTRFVLHWETDANDVDLHVSDARGNHAFYSAPKLATGGELYADVTTGYGPECFTIPGKPTAGPYKVSAHYYAQGPMGYGMGLLEVVRFDGKALAFEHKPFVITTNRATLELGTY